MATNDDATASRRGLLTIAATAAAAVPVGGTALLAQAADPDAELLRLAAELRTAEEALRVAVCRMADLDDAGAGDEADAASEVVEELLERMAATPAHGLPGIAAKAGRLTYSLSDTCTIMHAEKPLAASLAADLARLVPQAVVPLPAVIRPDPDAALEEMADAMVAGWAESQRLMEPYLDLVQFAYPPETRARLRALTDQHHALRKRLGATPATGPAGHRAKARALMLWLETGGPEDAQKPDWDDFLAWSLCRDILGRSAA